MSFTLTTLLQILAFGPREEVCSGLGNPDGDDGQESREGGSWKPDGSSWGSRRSKQWTQKIPEQRDAVLGKPVQK